MPFQAPTSWALWPFCFFEEFLYMLLSQQRQTLSPFGTTFGNSYTPRHESSSLPGSKDMLNFEGNETFDTISKWISSHPIHLPHHHQPANSLFVYQYLTVQDFFVLPMFVAKGSD